MTESNKNVLRSVWLWVKYAVLPALITGLVYDELLFNFFYTHPYILLIMAAAMFNAAMDMLFSIAKFQQSIFRNWRVDIWCEEIAWNKDNRIGGYKLTGWHLCKSAMVICLALAIVLYNPYVWWIDFLFIGYFWNITFSLFYDIIFKRK